MSTFCVEKTKCSVCASVSDQEVMMSTNSFGSPDLDLRPAEMQRSTMSWWIQECPSCGYISWQISDESSADAKWLDSEEFRKAETMNFKSRLAKKFYKLYLIQMNKNIETSEAFKAALYASWACDDAGDSKNAELCRKLVLPLLEKIIDEDNNDSYIIQKADIMRRAGMFDEVVNEYSKIELEDTFLNKIIKFQVEKAGQKDSECYKVSDVEQD